MPSSVIASHSYDPDIRLLRIVFTSGVAYLYKGVPPEVYKAFTISGSKGRYLNFIIKRTYPFEKEGSSTEE